MADVLKPTTSAGTRTRNRLREHQRDGHELLAIRERSDLKFATPSHPTWTLFSCTCRWMGWLANGEFEVANG